jgi:hypothetical protein
MNNLPTIADLPTFGKLPEALNEIFSDTTPCYATGARDRPTSPYERISRSARSEISVGFSAKSTYRAQNR